MTPQASSANVLVVGSGYLTQSELYRLGSITTAFNILILLLIGTPWLLFVTR
jgi:DASS family divalent anion:Na+ symporter